MSRWRLEGRSSATPTLVRRAVSSFMGRYSDLDLLSGSGRNTPLRAPGPMVAWNPAVLLRRYLWAAPPTCRAKERKGPPLRSLGTFAGDQAGGGSRSAGNSLRIESHVARSGSVSTVSDTRPPWTTTSTPPARRGWSAVRTTTAASSRRATSSPAVRTSRSSPACMRAGAARTRTRTGVSSSVVTRRCSVLRWVGDNGRITPFPLQLRWRSPEPRLAPDPALTGSFAGDTPRP